MKKVLITCDTMADADCAIKSMQKDGWQISAIGKFTNGLQPEKSDITFVKYERPNPIPAEFKGSDANPSIK